MRLWFKKLSVILITFMTLGMFIPPTYLDGKASDFFEQTNEESASSTNASGNLEEIQESTSDIYQDFISYASDQAKLQSLEKFGPKISNQVGDEFLESILPKMEEIIASIIQTKNKDELTRFEISEKPSSGYGEKIFHIFDQDTGRDLVRFHVSRVKHPREGHVFNFHYHLENDKYEHHYHIGDIFWDKNTPPKWMS